MDSPTEGLQITWLQINGQTLTKIYNSMFNEYGKNKA